MPILDLPIEQLREYRSVSPEPTDFDAWWAEQLEHLPEHTPLLSRQRVEAPFDLIEVEEVVFTGADGAPVRALLTLPAGAVQSLRPLPGAVQLVGYGGGRGLPGQIPWYAMAGLAHLIVDPRGQGADWGGGGSTPDPGSAGAHAAGWVTDGITDREAYYYRRAVLDSVAAVRLLQDLEEVDSARVATVGGSQGGGLALAAGALADGVAAVCVDSPFISDIPRGIVMAEEGPYLEIVRYLRVHPEHEADVLATCAYVDGVHFASRLTAPLLVATGLLDPVCPPSTAFAVHNAATAASERRIDVYPYGDHDGGSHRQVLAHCEWMRERL
ncbi:MULTISPECIES: acetylxylan esterase [unclassified Actinomyces]|uniref:acetylxylan esterase n=1 Tax=unclassified Actinomyces TaxID=2609248 RepID=UPI0020181465|nr:MULTISPECIES: acetylxylan esterase [unclassified Actinomyces]MCL3776608.1 acetylxylan esterase [Actinomyces sp. AC-20-1]MCL3790109.1 acetylxylan esterase [Actinomyces sp. 187325]MCL3792411.1 acetylxylan esterase [Actinomyces sp. 186855]MCL3793474.1 acetylxylan esterase [Actinomyces sp. 217892]